MQVSEENSQRQDAASKALLNRNCYGSGTAHDTLSSSSPFEQQSAFVELLQQIKGKRHNLIISKQHSIIDSKLPWQEHAL